MSGKTTTCTIPGVLVMSDGKEVPVKVEVESTYTFITFRINSKVTVDFTKLRASGELDESDLNTLEFGYPNATILFLGRLSSGPQAVCIGIKTGDHVYPKNMFFISEGAAVLCCTPTDDIHEVKPYN